MNKKQKPVSILLQLGLAFVFFYVGIAALINPNDWIGFFPFWLRSFFSDSFLIYFHSTTEILLALWLVSGKRLLYAATVSSLTLFGIILFNLGSLDIIFRDVAILFASLALVILHYESKV